MSMCVCVYAYVCVYEMTVHLCHHTQIIRNFTKIGKLTRCIASHLLYQEQLITLLEALINAIVVNVSSNCHVNDRLVCLLPNMKWH